MLTADAAERRTGQAGRITDLIRPALDYALMSAEPDSSRVLAAAGMFDEATETLRLRTGVRFSTRNGYAFETDSAVLDLEAGMVRGDAAVSGSAPWGAMRADGFEVREEGRRVILIGDVRTRIYMEEREEIPPEEADR